MDLVAVFLEQFSRILWLITVFLEIGSNLEIASERGK